MATVQLIDYTGIGREDERFHAAHVLIFTKSTRLNMNPELFKQVQEMSVEEMTAELDYMACTIPSSWEFIDVTFLLTGVSRACAQQITRTRTASYAMQSQRVTKLSEVDVVNPYPLGKSVKQDILHADFTNAAIDAVSNYGGMLQEGAEAQDARGLLPMNTECNLLCKYNFRNFVELIRARSSMRVQGEYHDIAQQMKAEVLQAWPWAEPFFKHPLDSAIEMLEGVVADIGLETGHGPGWQIAKAIDLMRKS